MPDRNLELMQALLSKRGKDLAGLAMGAPFQITQDEDGNLSLSVSIEITVQPASRTAIQSGCLVDVPETERGYYAVAIAVDKETNQCVQLTEWVEGETWAAALNELDKEIARRVRGQGDA